MKSILVLFCVVCSVGLAQSNVPPVFQEESFLLPIRVLYDPTWKKKFGANSVMTARSILAVAQEQFRNAYLTVFIDLKVVSIESTTMVIPSNSAGLAQNFSSDDESIKLTIALNFRDVCSGDLGGKTFDIGAVCANKAWRKAVVTYCFSDEFTGLNLAHEIGHALGMEHDFQNPYKDPKVVRYDEERQSCTNKGGIMDYFNQVGRLKKPQQWTKCSVRDFFDKYNFIAQTKKTLCLESRLAIKNGLSTGELTPNGITIMSQNKCFRLQMQYDGILALYYIPTGYRLWQEGDKQKGATRAALIKDGRFGLLDDKNNVIWQTPSTQYSSPYLQLQDSGNLELRAIKLHDSVLIWSSQTADKASCGGKVRRWINALLPYDALMIGSVLTSNNLAYKLQLNANGNLVLCRMTGIPDVIWTSDGNYPELPPSGKRAVNQPGVNKPGFSKGPCDFVQKELSFSPTKLVMQNDGNLVIQDGILQWSTNTTSPGAYFILQDDGSLVVYSYAGKPLKIIYNPLDQFSPFEPGRPFPPGRPPYQYP